MTKKPSLYTMRPLLALAMSVLLLLALTTNCLAKKVTPDAAFNEDRNRLIALMLSRQFPAQHFSHQPLDDNLSRKAFDLYLRQLDPRKRFLLQADVKQLNAFATHIDDELTRGRIVLADAGMDVLNDRIRPKSSILLRIWTNCGSGGACL
jgi:carboxyl-terminal processing protease